jgi:hypothetical protein
VKVETGHGANQQPAGPSQKPALLMMSLGGEKEKPRTEEGWDHQRRTTGPKKKVCLVGTE